MHSSIWLTVAYSIPILIFSNGTSLFFLATIGFPKIAASNAAVEFTVNTISDFKIFSYKFYVSMKTLFLFLVKFCTILEYSSLFSLG